MTYNNKNSIMLFILTRNSSWAETPFKSSKLKATTFPFTMVSCLGWDGWEVEVGDEELFDDTDLDGENWKSSSVFKSTTQLGLVRSASSVRVIVVGFDLKAIRLV